jgi:hypothetical protein
MTNARHGQPAWAKDYKAHTRMFSVFDDCGQLLGNVTKRRGYFRAYGFDNRPLSEEHFATECQAIDAVAAAAPTPAEREYARRLRGAVRQHEAKIAALAVASSERVAS